MKITFRLLFRIFYTSFFAILNIVLLGLLIITPADAIQQALNNDQLYNVFVISGCYLLTVVLCLLIYASRLYTNRTIIAAIPKTWIPVEKGDVTKNVRKMIVASLSRSAAIAWDSRPRIPSEPPAAVSQPENRDAIAIALPDSTKKPSTRRPNRRAETEVHEQMITIPPQRPVWGEISHHGWSSPTSPDLPNLQYTSVILELPHLIEARAVSLAPLDPTSRVEQRVPDSRAIALLRRPTSMGLRDYVNHLTGIGLIASPVANEFLVTYEHARFSGHPLSEPKFRDLMKQFAELLRNMDSLRHTTFGSPENIIPESDVDDDAKSTTTGTSQRSRSLVSSHSIPSRSGSEGTIRTAPSRRIITNETSTNGRMFSTAPATPVTPNSRKRPISRPTSLNSFAQSRRPYSGSSSSSGTSLKSSSSVIKTSLADNSNEFPYDLTYNGTDKSRDV